MTNFELDTFESSLQTAVAIVGMAARVPGADDVDRFFANLLEGVESITFLSEEECARAGLGISAGGSERYVGAAGMLDHIDQFDAEFFGMSPREAELTDPQHRLFLETAWHALEHAGYDPSGSSESIGVYGGTSANTYVFNLYSRPELMRGLDPHQLLIASEKDFLTTRVSYKLGLVGPSVLVQTACSTSLVAVHLACQALLGGECDVALAGGVSLRVPQRAGYVYREGSIYAPDGHCRPFDARAQGTVGGSGVGVVVLKRLAEALQNGDRIHAVIKGSAINNDGSQKAGYTAPGVGGQAAVIAQAHSVAGVDAASIAYVEAHGTGTKLGDPIEVAALTEAFRRTSDATQTCALGSLKANVGHLDAAAGVIGLIKAALVVERGLVPPTLHFRKPHPNIDFETSPFFVNSERLELAAAGGPSPRRAGVSSFGIGGTNAHVVLEQPPAQPAVAIARHGAVVLPLSARSPEALERMRLSLAERLESAELDPAEVAYTLQRGRHRFEHRTSVVCADLAAAPRALRSARPSSRALRDCRVAFAFPGQGAQVAGFGRTLYARGGVFRERLSLCDRLLAEHGVELLRVLYEDQRSDALSIDDTQLLQPVLFALAYSLAGELAELGIVPAAMIGHSVGELVAACLAGVFTLQDALGLVAARGRLMQSMPRGSMLVVGLPRDDVAAQLPAGVWVTGENGPRLTVVGGETAAVREFERQLAARNVFAKPLATSHAFHSPMMEGAVDELVRAASSVERRPPNIPFVSNVSGAWIGAQKACLASYWGEQMRQPVRLASGLRMLLGEGVNVFVEVGPGHGLTTLLRREFEVPRERALSVAGEGEATDEAGALLGCVARLWEVGVEPRWDALYSERPRRVALPGYAFERSRYWIERAEGAERGAVPDLPELSGGSATPVAAGLPVWEAKVTRHPRPELAEPYEAPRDEAERAVAAVFEELLGIDGVGRNDGFFELEGDSLLATQLTSRVRDRLSCELSIRDVFENPTPAALARILGATGRHGTRAPGPEVEAEIEVEPARDLPLSFAEERMFLLAQLAGDQPVHNLPAAVRIRGVISPHHLQRALELFVARHDALRTTFHRQDQRLVRRVAAEQRVELRVVDMTPEGLTPWLAEEARQPFELDRGPLFRVALLRLSDNEVVLSWTCHHLVFDGWSERIFSKELAELYAACVAARRPNLPALPLSCAGVAVEQRSAEAGARIERQLAYFRRALQGAPHVLELPTDWPRPPHFSFRGGEHIVLVPSELLEGLNGLARRAGATLFVVLSAAYALLLSRLSGQRDLLIGSPLSGRVDVRTEGLIGCFINTLPLRFQLGDDPTFIELLARTRGVLLDAHANQEAPFSRLLHELGVERDPSRNPLCQAMFVLQNAHNEMLVAEGEIHLGLVPTSAGTASCDLLLALAQGPHGGLIGSFQYAADLFAPETVMRFGDAFRRILEEVVKQPERRASTVPLLSADERSALLKRSQGPHVNYLQQRSIPAAFEAIVQAQPAAPALEDGGETLSYGELNQRARQLAAELVAAGMGPEGVVGILAQRSAAAVVALLAVSMAGAAYLPLEVSWPDARVELVLREAGAKVVLADLDQRERLRGSALRVRGLQAEGTRAVVDLPCPDPDSLAYVMYTSGSTGRPKGVAATHANVLRLVIGADYVELGPSERLLLHAPLAFDASTFEIWGALLRGGTLVVAPRRALGPRELGSFVAHARVSTAWLTAPLFHEIVRADPKLLGTLRQLLTGGDVVSPQRAAEFLDAAPTTRLLNGYGPTECVTFACVGRVSGRPQSSSLRLGRPIANSRAYVLDSGLELLPKGAVGEIWIGGDGVARGYLNDPRATAERFRPDPFSERGGARMYRTGDRGRYDDCGELEFLGRVDRQVKLRGQRIELGEVELYLRRLPGVHDAVARVEERDGDKRLVAFLAAAEPQRPDTYRQILRTQLPEAAVPAVIEVRDTLPLTTNGKVATAALSAAPGAETPPPLPLETVVAEIFGELLARTDVGREDSFFALGGDSLLAMRLVAELERRLDVKLPLLTVFERPTVAELARCIAPPELAPSSSQAASSAAPLSFFQERLWFLERLAGPSATYNVPLALEVSTPLNPRLLERAFTTLIERHELLSSCFPDETGVPVRRRVAGPIRLEREDCRGQSEQSQRQLIEQRAFEPFQLTTGPLVRLQLFEMTDRQQVLLLCAHHSVCDGWSMDLLLAELGELYRALESGRVAALSPLPICYTEYVEQQRRGLTSERERTHLEGLRASLGEGLEPLALPFDKPRPRTTARRGAVVSLDLPESACRALLEAAREAGATPFVALLAGYHALLSRFTGQRLTRVASPAADRERLELQGLVGPCLNTLVLCAAIADDTSSVDLIGRVREALVTAMRHRELPFERLVESLDLPRDLDRSPLVQTMFSVLPVARAGELGAGHGLRPYPLRTRAAKFELMLSLEPCATGFVAHFEYDADAFDEGTVARLGRHYRALIEAMGARPLAPLLDLSLCSEDEQSELLALGAGPRVELAKDGLLQRIFRSVVDAPSRVAVRDGRRSLTYAELWTAAATVAAGLAERGAEPARPVVLVMRRSLELIVALVATLRTGAPFVPIDVSQPSSRLDRMVVDAEPAVVVCDEALESRDQDERWVRYEELAARSRVGQPPLHAASGGSPAYVIFTSGSSGAPKGVVCSHVGLLNLLDDFARRAPIDAESTHASWASSGFDVFVLEALAPLTSGGSLDLVPDDVRVDGAALVEWLVERQIASAYVPPHLLADLELQLSRRATSPSLRRLLVGVEPIPEALLSRLIEAVPGLRILNGYGPTEATVCATFYDVPPGQRHERRTPIGRPLQNTQLYLLDERLRLVPRGVVGELWIGGVGVALGYLRRDDENSARFREDPFGGGRVYRTGDFGRWLPDGELSFVGRRDQQIKISGVRVEQGEVENVLREHPAVSNAILLVKHVQERPQLVAYVAGRVDAAELSAFARRRLPREMVPARIVVLPALPLTANGKVDRSALPEAGAAPTPQVGPRDALEQLVAAAFSEVLGTDTTSVHDDFFQLGGSSLQASRLAARLSSELRTRVDVRDVYESATVDAIAARLRRGEAWAGSTPVLRAPALADDVERMSGEELDQLLSRLEPGEGRSVT